MAEASSRKAAGFDLKPVRSWRTQHCPGPFAPRVKHLGLISDGNLSGFSFQPLVLVQPFPARLSSPSAPGIFPLWFVLTCYLSSTNHVLGAAPDRVGEGEGGRRGRKCISLRRRKDQRRTPPSQATCLSTTAWGNVSSRLRLGGRPAAQPREAAWLWAPRTGTASEPPSSTQGTGRDSGGCLSPWCSAGPLGAGTRQQPPAQSSPWCPGRCPRAGSLPPPPSSIWASP